MPCNCNKNKEAGRRVYQAKLPDGTTRTFSSEADRNLFVQRSGAKKI